MIRRLNWDNVGVVVSSLCVVHCVGLPLMAAILPFLSWVPDERVHWLLTFLAMPVGCLALIPGYLRHRRRQVPLLGGMGLALMVSAPMLPWAGIEQLVTTLGGFSVVAAHLANRAHCSCNRC